MPFIERPTFVGWIVLLTQIPFQLFMTFWAGMFFGGFAQTLGGFRGEAPFILFGLIAFIGIPLVTYFGKKLNYGRTEYKFFDEYLEFEEGFFSQNRKIVRYRDILEVSLRKGVLQRAYNLGTIYLGTLATGSASQSNSFSTLGFGNISASGVGIKDILDPEVTYDRIRKLVDAAKSS